MEKTELARRYESLLMALRRRDGSDPLAVHFAGLMEKAGLKSVEEAAALTRELGPKALLAEESLADPRYIQHKLRILHYFMAGEPAADAAAYLACFLTIRGFGSRVLEHVIAFRESRQGLSSPRAGAQGATEAMENAVKVIRMPARVLLAAAACLIAAVGLAGGYFALRPRPAPILLTMKGDTATLVVLGRDGKTLLGDGNEIQAGSVLALSLGFTSSDAYVMAWYEELSADGAVASRAILFPAKGEKARPVPLAGLDLGSLRTATGDAGKTIVFYAARLEKPARATDATIASLRKKADSGPIERLSIRITADD